MIFETTSIDVKTTKREQFILITQNIQDVVKKSNVNAGVCKIFIPHTTAAVTINENADPDVITDMLTILGELIPQQRRFLHSEGNSDAHIKSSMIGCQIDVSISNGKMMLGQWQGIFFIELDGPRMRKVHVTVFGE